MFWNDRFPLLTVICCVSVFAEESADFREKLSSCETLWKLNRTVELKAASETLWNKLPRETVKFSVPKIPDGKTPLLRFTAIRLTKDPARKGHRYAPAFLLNGKELGLLTDSGKARLVNRPLYLPNSWTRGYHKRMYNFETQHYTALLLPQALNDGKTPPWEYVLDVSDALRQGENTLEIIHDGNPADGPTTIPVAGLSILAAPSAALDQIRTKPPKVLSAVEKADFLLSKAKAGHPLKALQKISDPQERLRRTAEYFRTRTPRVQTVGGVMTRRGTPLSPRKRNGSMTPCRIVSPPI